MNTNIIMQEKSIKNMTVPEAAKEMGKSQQYIRIGIQRGVFTFGIAQIMPNSQKYTYYISPVLFYKYIGKPLPSKYKDNEEVETNVTGRYAVITDPAVARQINWNWKGL